MDKKYRLGIDLGTNSLGWALWDFGKDDGAPAIVDAGVRIFTDGREPGKNDSPGESLAVERRVARGMRRRRDRLLQRKRKLINTLIVGELWPRSPEKRTEAISKDPYALRGKAVDEDVSGEELSRILLHLCQRRGFKSNRKDSSQKDDEKGKNKARIKALNEELERQSAATLGAYLNARKHRGARFRDDSAYYPDRAHYKEEFDLIKERQKMNFPALDWEKLEKIIFDQRPLKAQVKGKCPYYTDEDRAHNALPSTHRFRILQELQNLNLINPHGETVNLSRDERDCLFDLLERTKKVKFKSIRTHLNKSVDGPILDDSWRFNLESEKREALNGNSTSCDMRKPEMFGNLWDELDDELQDEIVDTIMEAEENGEIEVYLMDNHSLSGKLSREQRQNISETTFGKGISRFSTILHRECVRVMKRDYVGYYEAMAALGFDHRAKEGTGELAELPYYGEVLPESCVKRKTPNQNREEAEFGKIGNPTVHIALNQVRRVLNAIIARHGKPAEIVLELSRDLKNGRKKIAEIISEQAKNQKNNEALDKDLRESHYLVNPSRDDREKLMYFNELRRENAGAPCPYCGKGISAAELFTGSIEVEHILPFSRTLDDSRGNKTLAHKNCNQFKGDRSPYEAFGDSPPGYNWNHIQERIKSLPKNKQNKFRADAMEKREKDDSFLARQLTDGAYASRVARRYLSSICPPNKIWCVTGSHTAQLRWNWGLNTILSKQSGKKNRSDHRHHALDAAVIALVDRSLIKKIADANRKNDENSGRRFSYKAPDFPGGEEGLQNLKNTVRDILPSFKPDHGIQGRFFKETAYGKKKMPLLLETAKLKEDMTGNIVSAEIRQEFQEDIADQGFKKAKDALAARHERLYVFEELWISSKPLTALKMGDLQEPSYGHNTKGPSDLGLRRRLRAYVTEQAGHDSPTDKEVEKILAGYGQKQSIRRVRYIPKNQAITPIKGSPGKGYEIDGYAYVDVWEIPQKKGKLPKYEGVFVSFLEAAHIDQGISRPCKPHPAAKKITRLFKNDTLRVEGEGTPRFYRVTGYNTTQNKIDIQPIWRAGDDWFEATNPQSLHSGQMENTGMQNQKSINVLWQRGNIRKITVNCDGSYR